MTTITDEHDLVRQQYFECDGPVDVDIEWGAGTVEVRFADEPDSTGTGRSTAGTDASDTDTTGADTTGADTTDRDTNAAYATETTGGDHAEARPAIIVEVRPEQRPAWGLLGLLSWVGEQIGGQGGDLAAEAVRHTSIEARGNRLTVRSPRSMPLRGVPMSVVVHAPAGSSLHAKAGSAKVRVGGPADRVHVDNGSGDVSVDRAAGPVQVKTGSGSVHLGPMLNGVTARTGSGDIEVTSVRGAGAMHSGSGDIWIGTVLGDEVTVRTGSGDLTVADAAAGRLQLTTGSGDLRVGIRTGVLAEVDVLSGSGRARSDLPMTDEPPQVEPPVLSVRARTGSGEAVISPATA